MTTDANNQQLFAAAQTYPGAPAQAIEQLKPLADAGDDRAIAMLAYFYLQQGQIDEALPYGTQALQHGYGQLAQLLANDLAQRQRPELRIRIPEFVDAALEGGWPLDFFNLITVSAQQGQPDVVVQLLDLAKQPRPQRQIGQWEELLAQVEAERKQVTSAAAEIAGQRDQATTEINEGTEAIRVRRKEAERQAEELGILTSSIAAENLADAYAKDATQTEKQSKTYTWASLVVGAVSVAISVVGLLTVKEGSSFETVIAHAAFGVPVALLAAYVNTLASSHRREAWRLRHIELQIRTANPFLGLLDDERRRETLASLALRFFPGQDGVTSDQTDSGELQLDVIEALRRLLREQHPAGTATATTPAPGETP